ncbi:MAG: glutamine--fructose-6-phosphate aminotransferase [isomerizing] [Silanimonas sp.]|nr:MAG: glutamine--fructose-6-phosphate aminotransferase [isomerizing] [Silanimonas sp.]GIX39985.1 MAG: glutamine--fructose-6-phosphate aminotransferase [isomerizing] [Silanimonas sp.]
MCGIVGAIAGRDVVPVLIDGLKRLEYRGYDSAGVAVLDSELRRVRRTGRVAEMEAAAHAEGLAASLGIGHTRWATHGGVTEANAHPHISEGELALVHNGIIENHEEQRERLKALGYEFGSQTDTEVVAHLVRHYLRETGDLLSATQRAVRELRGAYALAIIARSDPSRLVVARMGCPLLVGLGEGEAFVASDVSAVVAQTRRVVYLEEGDVAEVRRNGLAVFDATGTAVQRAEQVSGVSLASLELGPYRHFMQKEIHEQPRAIADTLEPILETGFSPALFGPRGPELLAGVTGVQILACGTSHYAGLVARYWIEALAGLPCAVDIASEYRYRPIVANPGTLVVTISQSGETLDTLEALKYAIAEGHHRTLSICNVAESAIPRLSAMQFLTRAGAEIGVASTKAFTTQLVALFALALVIAKARGRLAAQDEALHIETLRHLPGSVQHALNLEPQIAAWAETFAPKQHALFLGRGLHFPIALEGALKLKEISYIHAEAYAAGELKHGPLALVDREMPVVVIAPNDALLEKVKSNIHEVRARGGEMFVFADADSQFGEEEGLHVIRTPRHVGLLSPVVHAVPVQMLAYHTALARGTDVDKPRNLAKSVTVE